MSGIGAYGLQGIAPASQIGAALQGASAGEAAAAAMSAIAGRIVDVVARDGGFPGQDAARVWSRLADAAGAPADAGKTQSRADDPYGVEPLARDLAHASGGGSPAAEGTLLKALDRFTAAAAVQVAAGRRGSAAEALGPVALSLAGALNGTAGGPAIDQITGAIDRAAHALETEALTGT